MAILDTGLLLAFAIILLLSSATPATKLCEQTYYVEIGTRGLIPCSCNGSSLAIIAWVNVNEGKTLLLRHDDDKRGDGYESREYDIYPNGSLLINNVTASHESVYRVSTAISSFGSRISKNICVHTTVKPAITFPVVKECSNTYGTTCVKSTTDSVEVNCFVRDSRPAVKLSWSLRTHGGDHILPSNYRNFTMDNVTYTSHVTATFSFGESSVLSLLVCRANNVPLNLVEDENVLLIENEMDYTSLATPIRRYLKIHSPMKLTCADLGLNVVIWKWSPERDAFETLYVSIFQNSNHTKISNREYRLEDEGSLSLQNTLVEHKGLYACVYDNGVSGGIVLYDVLVMVDPTPVFPVIDGCNHQQYCVLEKQLQDVLTCSVLGIRPKVALEWRAFREETAIDFTQRQLTVTQMGDVYDISLTVNFDFSQTTQNKVTVECRAVGENAELFSLSTKIDLLFPNEQRSYTSTITIIAVLVTMVIIIITVAVVIVCRIRARKVRMKKIKRGDTENEDIPMMENTNDYSEKAERFIEHLKAKYEYFTILCNQSPTLKIGCIAWTRFECYYLPDTIPVGSIPSSLKSRNVKVWSLDYSSSFHCRDLQTSGWQTCDILGNLPGEEGYEGPIPLKDEEDISATSLSGSPVPSKSADVPHPEKGCYNDSTAAVTLNYTKLKDALTKLLSTNDCHQLARHVALPTDQLDAIINSNLSTKDLLDVLEERGVIHLSNVSRLLEAISVLKINETALSMLERYQTSTDQVFSTSLRAMLMINKEGGKLDIPGTGASLEIPSGALDGKQRIEMRIIPPRLESESLTFASNSSLVVELLPSHVNLLKPAILTIPHCLVLKKGCEWKAKIYRSHHKEGSEPQWEEQFRTYYKLGEHNCVIEIQRFSWEKFVVHGKIVEAKNIIVYAAGRCGPTDSSMYLDIGYYWDLASCKQVSNMNNASFLYRKRTIFYNDGKDLNISLKEFKPMNWTCSTEETKTQVIPFDHVAICQGTDCTFELYKTNGTEACTCLFKAGQAPNLEDYIFLLKAPDPLRQEAARAGIPASDRVVTTATIQDLSHQLCDEWRIVCRELGIGDPKLQAIHRDNRTAQEKVYQMLLTWKQSKGNEATYNLLGKALKSAGRKDLQEYLYQNAIHEDERPSEMRGHVKRDGLSIPEDPAQIRRRSRKKCTVS